MAATGTKASLPESVQHMADYLRTLGYEKNTVILPAAGKTPAEAAAGLDYSVVETAKSIIFRRAEDDVPVPVTVSGTNRVDEAKVSAHVGALVKADAKLAREKTGYAIGSVRPANHAVKSVTLFDQDLFQYDSLWVATGHPRAMFNLAPTELEAMTGVSVADIARCD